jgi:hypothetical protein
VAPAPPEQGACAAFPRRGMREPAAAMASSGLVTSKTASGRFPSVATPSVAAIEASQLFQAMSAEVGVPEAPIVRDRTTAASRRFSKATLNMRPGSTIAVY